MSSTRPPDVVLGPADTGGSRALQLHQCLRLDLPEAPTSGFRWQGADAPGDDPVLRCLSSDYAPPAAGTVGGKGQRRWVFEACAAGSTALQLRLQRPGGGAAVDTFSLTVRVAA